MNKTSRYLLSAVVIVIGAVGAGRYLHSHRGTTPVTSSTTSMAASPACIANDFVASFNSGQGAAGNILASASLTKTSVGSCHLSGWPLLSLSNSAGVSIPTTTVEGSQVFLNVFSLTVPSTPAHLLVAQNRVVTFEIFYNEVPGLAACPVASSLGISLSSSGVMLGSTAVNALTPCDHHLNVSPFFLEP